MNKGKISTLYVVATPIGNLLDLSLRAVEVLKQVDRIAAEDTRHSAPLLKHYLIRKPTLSLHDFNERQRVDQVIAYLAAGESIALISDAGTPLISDPGFRLVREVRAQGFAVVPVPGACAAIAALCASGLPTDKFLFEGFLPSKAESRKQSLTVLAKETRTLIFYEAPHRLLSSLKAMSDCFGADRKATVARELTKVYESILTRPLSGLVEYFEAHPGECRGEMVLLVEGSAAESSSASEAEEVLVLLLEALPLKQAVTLASKITGARKNVLYELALSKQKREMK